MDTYLEDNLRGGGTDERRCDMDNGINAWIIHAGDRLGVASASSRLLEASIRHFCVTKLSRPETRLRS
jgi:hypothetical protein